MSVKFKKKSWCCIRKLKTKTNGYNWITIVEFVPLKTNQYISIISLNNLFLIIIILIQLDSTARPFFPSILKNNLVKSN